MKLYLKILLVFMSLMSCQANKKEDNSLGSVSKKEESFQKKSPEAASDVQAKTILTKAQFNDFFPKEIGAYKLINVSVLMSSALASGSYIKNNDYNTSMTYSLEDGHRKGSAVLRNFEDAYNIKNQGPQGTKYLYIERDGYKTIAFLQPIIIRNDVGFVYNNRFRITMEGIEDVDVLWSYIKKEDLQKLDNY